MSEERCSAFLSGEHFDPVLNVIDPVLKLIAQNGHNPPFARGHKG
jgi:hypothetical protein